MKIKNNTKPKKIKNYTLVKKRYFPDYERFLYRIKAIRDIPERNIKKETIGGWVESEKNLSGNAWVYNNAKVLDSACIYGNAIVCQNSVVSGNARVFGNAIINDDAKIDGYAKVFGNARVVDSARISQSAKVSGKAIINGESLVTGEARVSGNARVTSSSLIFDTAKISGNAAISGSVVNDDAYVSGNASIIGSYIRDDAKVYGNAIVECASTVYGNAIVCEAGKVTNSAYIGDDAFIIHDVLVLGSFGNLYRTIYAFWTTNNKVYVKAGCFYGTIEQFKQASIKKYGTTSKNEYLQLIPILKAKEKKWRREWKQFQETIRSLY